MNIIYIKTQDWIIDLAKDEIEDFTNFKSKEIDNNILEIKIPNENDLFEFVYELVYYSRTIENIYLKIEKNNSKLNLPKIDLDIKNEKINVFDLVGFNLSKREFRLNENSNSINSLIINCCFYMLGLDEEKSYSIIDPIANFGEIIIEASIFNPRKPLNIKLRNELNIFKCFEKRTQIPKVSVDKNKYYAIVQNDIEFSKLKENLNKASQKVKLSKFDLDYLDVKFKEEQFDFVISSLPLFKDEKYKDKFLDQFFYQAEFISKCAIAIITREKIDNKYLKKHNLEIENCEEIILKKQKYYIYLIC